MYRCAPPAFARSRLAKSCPRPSAEMLALKLFPMVAGLSGCGGARQRVRTMRKGAVASRLNVSGALRRFVSVAVRRWLIERRKGQEFLRRERRLAELVPAIEQIKAELSTRRAEIAAAEKSNSTLKAAVKAKDKRNALDAIVDGNLKLDRGR